MTDYYFDIETVPLEQFRAKYEDPTIKKIINPVECKIISIQYQPIWSDTGKPKGELQILKEWESNEENIIKLLVEVMFPRGIPPEKIHWAFVPIGNNLMYEFKFLIPRLKQFCNIELDISEKPFFDIKHILIGINNARFIGYSELIGKGGEARNISGWYYSKEYDKIIDYIQRETKGFISNYQILMNELPILRKKLNSNQ